MDKAAENNMAIVVSGGPAPGINSVISSCVIEAVNQGYLIFGLQNGFQGFSSHGDAALIPLTIEEVAGIYNTGGSILGTSRFNPFRDHAHKEQFLAGLKKSKIGKLVVIGGEGSAYLSYTLGKIAPWLQVVHVPKTIDNDLILPNHHPSFGFETARYAGTSIIETLMLDAKTTERWFVVTSMGRKAGFLALGLGLAAGATLTVIPEEFDQQVSPNQVAEIIFGSMKKRAGLGKFYGVAILAEGILDRLIPDQDPLLSDCARDELGRIKYSQIELGDVIHPILRRLCLEASLEIKIGVKNIGYELRCQHPVSFDIEYTKFLGFGAVKLLNEGLSNVMVTRNFDRIGHETLDSIVRPDGTVRSRKVDLESDLYKVARSFMIR